MAHRGHKLQPQQSGVADKVLQWWLCAMVAVSSSTLLLAGGYYANGAGCRNNWCFLNDVWSSSAGSATDWTEVMSDGG